MTFSTGGTGSAPKSKWISKLWSMVLSEKGPGLRRPHVGPIVTSRHANMKELIIQHAGKPYRVLFAFDPRRTAILLIGGNKAGNDHWYEEFVPIADRLYDERFMQLKKEGRI